MPNIAVIRLADDPVLSIVPASQERIALSKARLPDGQARDASFALYVHVFSLSPINLPAGQARRTGGQAGLAVSVIDKGVVVDKEWWRG